MKNIRLIQDFVIPALDSATYGDLLKWDTEFGVFMIKWTHKARSSWTAEDSRVFIAWDQLKGRPIPQTHQEFVDSKQRLRAALRNLRTIQDVPSNDDYRRYRITDLQDQRVKKETSHVDLSEHQIDLKNISILPRRSTRKAKAERFMYEDDSSSDLWTPPQRQQVPKSKKRGLKIKEESKTNLRNNKRLKVESQDPGPSTSYAPNPGPSTSYAPNPGTSTSYTSSLGVPPEKNEDIKKERLKEDPSFIPWIETGVIPKKNRELASLFQSSGINYDRKNKCRRQTRNSGYWSGKGMKGEGSPLPVCLPEEKPPVNQEAMVSNLQIKQEPKEAIIVNQTMASCSNQMKREKTDNKVQATTSNSEKIRKEKKRDEVQELVPNSQNEERKDEKNKKTVTKPEKDENSEKCMKVASDEVNEKSSKKKKKSKKNKKKEKSPLFSVPKTLETPTVRPTQEPVEENIQRSEDVAPTIENEHDERYRVFEHVTGRYDEDRKTRAYINGDLSFPWFWGIGSSDVDIPMVYPEESRPMEVLGVELNSFDNLPEWL